jgi:hypothetical protein
MDAIEQQTDVETDDDRRLWREPLFVLRFPDGSEATLSGDGRATGLPPGTVINNRYAALIEHLLGRLELVGLAQHR